MLDFALLPTLPERIDLKLTNWCDAACPWCNERSVTTGGHADIGPVLDLLSVLPEEAEVTIGGGDPLSHPQFEELAHGLAGRGLIVNVTVNGRHFKRHAATLKALTGLGVVRTVGVSYGGEFPGWHYEHLEQHLLIGIDETYVLDQRPSMKLRLLGYQSHGRGQYHYGRKRAQISERIGRWSRELPMLAMRHSLSFDALALEQLNPSRLFKDHADYQRCVLAAKRQCSIYVDAVTRTFAVSAYAETREPWTDVQSMFRRVRQIAAEATAPEAEAAVAS